ncbi:uncharacterized protein LOC142526157 [Primulina tabacum]|uniref:uncharacterized protein LOC142526157 n=1 Tax=Primulina tabacum TaxID=48773 RepID=UPI003F59D31B
MDMPSPQSVRDVQKLTGRIAACHAFQDLKKHLAELLILAKPEPGEKLWVYLSSTEFVVSSVLVREEGADQKPIYYVSHALREAELKYSELEKIALALVMTARKLRPYFLSHPIVVLTNSPLGRIMTHAEVSGRMVKWTVELGEYDIEYKPRAAIKAQALTDFLIEMIQPVEEKVWRVFVDGASNLSECGVGVVLIAPSEEKIKLALRIDSRIINNEAEYEAVLAGLQAAREVASLTDWNIEQIPRKENAEADALAKLAASMSDISTREVLCFTRLMLSINEEMPPTQRSSWMTPIIEYGILRKLISNNGRQFQGKKITSWCQEMKIIQSFTSVAYPQANGQTEVTNRIIVQAFLVYGSEAVLPVEIGQSSTRIESYPSNNEQSRAIELDLVEERRDRAAIRMEAYRSRVMKSYNKHVRSRDFQVGDLVMKKIKPVGDVRKLEARWEGPFKIARRVSSGAAYYLEDYRDTALRDHGMLFI